MKIHLNHVPKLIGLVSLVLLVTCTKSTHSGRPASVIVNKCCKNGEYLNSEQKCVAGGTDKWWPKIFLILKRQFYPKTGEVPQHMKAQEATKPNECKSPNLIEGDQNVIFSNGSLYLAERHVILDPSSFCVDKDSALVCLQRDNNVDSLRAPEKLSIVRKCCGPNSVYINENNTCKILNSKEADLYPPVVRSQQIDLIFGFPNCDETLGYAIAGQFFKENLDEKSGKVSLESGKEFDVGQYCLEHISEDKAISVFTCSQHFEAIPLPKQDYRLQIYAIGLLISVIFLVATLAAGYLVPSNHHVLHWRCQTHYVACLLVGDFLLAVTQLAGNTIAQPTCTIIAISMHFFFLAAFFWLNTMCFNIWWTFRDFRPTSLEKGQELFRLRMYEIYAWGVPFIIAGVAAILDHLPEHPENTFLRPNFGKNTCWFYGDKEIFTYFFGPIGFLLCINVLLFASTTRQLTCGLWKRDDVKSTTERAALGRVCMKLVIVMGVTWVADVLSWAIGGPSYLWIVTDMINALQGVFIFAVVGCQPQVWAALKRLWSSKTGRHFLNTTNGAQHSSSSHGLPSMGESFTNNTFSNTTSTKIPVETVC